MATQQPPLCKKSCTDDFGNPPDKSTMLKLPAEPSAPPRLKQDVSADFFFRADHSLVLLLVFRKLKYFKAELAAVLGRCLSYCLLIIPLFCSGLSQIEIFQS
jgi:hypothetical protein